MPSVELANGRRDGIPNVVVEAMAMGMACVGSRAAGLEEIIIDGVNGLLSDAGDPRSLADAIEQVLREPERLDAMGARARGRVLEEFDTDKNIERLVALFGDDAAGEPRARAAGGMR
jgi:glycosyltransferase involved in cell wall biosynthesis